MRGDLKINQHQSIASFFSKAFPRPIEANLQRGSDGDLTLTPFANVSSGSIVVGRGKKAQLRISLKRTVRVPEERRSYHLPPDLGDFPLFDIRPFSSRLPPSSVAKGGLFFPMYRESDSSPSCKAVSHGSRMVPHTVASAPYPYPSHPPPPPSPISDPPLLLLHTVPVPETKPVIYRA